MILIGLNEKQKQDEIVRYVKSHPVKGVIVFSPDKFSLNLPDLGDVPIREIEYKEVIMYRTFYPLQEEIDDGYLLVVNEFLRVKNRNDLTYNCLRHYLGQCGDQIVFEYFPFIEAATEFMALLDFDTKSKYKGTGFSPELLEAENVKCVNHHIKLSIETVPLPSGAEEEYDNKKSELFDNLGNKEPDTIPRALHVYCGRWKKPFLSPERNYVARNARFKFPNVTTYPRVVQGEKYTLLDFQHRRLDMNDFLRRTGRSDVTFLSTGLSVDNYYISAFREWLERLEEFYAQAGVYARNR